LYIFIFSESGILERRELNQKYNQLTAKIDYIKAANLKLLKECEKYRPGFYSNSEIINSGFVYKTGKVVYFYENEKEKASGIEVLQDEFLISTEHLRIIWIMISIMLLAYYFLKKNKSDDLINGPDFN